MRVCMVCACVCVMHEWSVYVMCVRMYMCVSGGVVCACMSLCVNEWSVRVHVWEGVWGKAIPKVLSPHPPQV